MRSTPEGGLHLDMNQQASEPPRQSGYLKRRFALLLQSHPLQLAAETAGSAACHLVGGALRDVALGMEYRDLDLVIERDGLEFARRLAVSLPARLVELGGDRFAAYRLIAENLTLDIWDRRGESLEADLTRRDLTIHSFAIDLPSAKLIDPFDGIADLENRILRATTETSFSSDPLRVLRLVRFAGQLPHFSPTQGTLELAASSAADLDEVAAERVRIELERILTAPWFLAAADLLIDLQLYPGLWQSSPGQGPSSQEAEELTSRLHLLELFADHSQNRVERATARQGLLFASLPISSDRPPSATVDRALRIGLLTKASAQRLRQLLSWDRLPEEVSDRRWLLHRNGDLWPTVVCLLAVRAEMPCSLSAYEDQLNLFDTLCRESGPEIFDPAPLLTGSDLVSHLGLVEGRALGQILATLRRQQIEGRLADREEALARAKELMQKGPGDRD